MNNKQLSAAIEAQPLDPKLGVLVSGLNLRVPLTQLQLDEIKRLWHHHCIVVFKDQSLTEEEQVAFGLQFGPLVHTLKKFAITDNPAVMYVTNEKKNGEYQGALPDGEMYFHMDMCYVKAPSAASILYAMNLPAQGGDTLFANMYAAYEELDSDTKSLIDERLAINSYDPGKSNYAATRATTDYRSDSELSYLQPMVYRHPVTQRKALYVNRVMTRQVEGMSVAESSALLERLFAHQEQNQFVYRHCWTLGDVVMWDNRCTLHARTHFDGGELRKMRRVTIEGQPLY